MKTVACKVTLLLGNVKETSATGIRYKNLFGRLSATYLFESLSYSMPYAINSTHQNYFVSKSGNSHFKLVMYKLLNRIMYPDIYIWKIPLYKKVIKDEMEIEDSTAVVIGVAPFSLLLMSKFIRNLAPDSILIADMSDPFSFNMVNHHSRIKRYIAMIIEKKAFAYFHHIVVLNGSIQRIYREFYPQWYDKFVVIEQGVDDGFIDRVKLAERSEKSKYILLYAGSFYKKGRNPRSLYRAFEKSKLNAELQIYGNIKKSLRPDKITGILYHAAVSKEELISVTANADAIILFDNDYGFQVPGKTLESLSIDKPILFIYNNMQSPTLEYLQAAKNVVFVRNNTESIESGLKQIVNEKVRACGFDCSAYTWKTMSDKYLKIFTCYQGN